MGLSTCKRAQGGEDTTAQLGWTGDNGDPDNFFFLDGCTDGKPASNNIPKWCNAEFNDLLAKARAVPDQAERAKLYTRMQEIDAYRAARASCLRIRPCSRPCAPT